MVITNLAPMPPFTAAIGLGVYPEIETIRNLIESKTKRLIAFDANALAEKAGNIMAVNMVLLGALLSTEILPLTADNVREAIRTRTKKALAASAARARSRGRLPTELLNEVFMVLHQ